MNEQRLKAELDKVFARYPHATINLSVVTVLIINELECVPSDYDATYEKVKSYLYEVCAAPKSAYQFAKGKFDEVRIQKC